MPGFPVDGHIYRGDFHYIHSIPSYPDVTITGMPLNWALVSHSINPFLPCNFANLTKITNCGSISQSFLVTEGCN